MPWILIDAITHEVVSGPHAEEPQAEGAYSVLAAIGWQSTMAWSPAQRGFVDIATPALTLSRIAYQRLFTQAERIAIRGSTDPIVVDFRELAAIADTIDLSDPDVITGAEYLETLGLIGAGRAAHVLIGQSPA